MLEKYELFEEHITSFMFVYPLAFALNKSVKNDGVCENTLKILDAWLDSNLGNISSNKQSYRVISTVIKTFGISHNISNYVALACKISFGDGE